MARKTLVGVKYVDLGGNTMEIVDKDGNLWAKIIAFGPGVEGVLGDSFDINSTVADQREVIADFEIQELLGNVEEVE